MLRQKLIFYAKNVGLANRLRALAGYYALAKAKGSELYVCWIPDAGCQAHFNSLFKTDLATEFDFITERKADQIKHATAESECDWYNNIYDRYSEEIEINKKKFCLKARSFLRDLQPVESIAIQIEDTIGNNDMSEVLGLHIRWTDNIEAYSSWSEVESFDIKHVSRLSPFLDLLERRDKVFVATDNRYIHSLVEHLYQDRLISFDRKFIDKGTIKYQLKKVIRKLGGVYSAGNNRATAIEDAVLDLFLLARCGKIIGTYFSSYSKIAAVIGEVDYHEVRGFDVVPLNLP